MKKDGSFKGNPLYFGRKDGGLVDVIEKMNKQNPSDNNCDGNNDNFHQNSKYLFLWHFFLFGVND